LLWVRNVLLNWTVFIPALFSAVLAPNVYLALITWFAVLAREPATWFGFHPVAVVLLGIASVSLFFATWQTIRNMPSHREGGNPPISYVRCRIVVPAVFFGGLVPLVLAAGRYKADSVFSFCESILFWLLVFSFTAKIAGYLFAWITNKKNRRLYLRNILT